MVYSLNFQWKRKTVTVTAGTALTTGYQVKLMIPKEAEMQADFRDLRFETTDGFGLPHWLESINTVSTPDEATVWVKLKAAVNASSTVDIYMYYGNPYVVSASNGTNTFIDFTDFNDLSGFTQQLGTWSVSNGYLITTQTVEQANYLRRDTPLPAPPYIASFRVRHLVNGGGRGIIFEGNNPLTTSSIMWAIATHTDLLYLNINSDWAVQSGVATDINIWYIGNVQVKASDNIATVYTDGRTSLLGTKTNTANSSGTGHYWGFCMYASDPGEHFDWVFVRKYVDTEPAIPTIGSTATTVNWNPQQAMNTFSRRKKLTINNNSGGTLTDYQVPITVTYVPAIQVDFDDIRFVDASGNLLPYWIEDKTDSDHAHVWIKVNLPNYGTSPVGDNIVYMYYGNSNLASASDITNIFLLYENFESYTVGATINGVNGWVVLDGYGGGSLTTVQTDYAVSPGIKSLRVGATSSGNQRNDAVKTLPSKITDDIIVELDFRTTKPAVHSGGGDTIQWSYAGCCHIMDDAKLAAGISLGRGYAAQGDDFIWHQPDGTVMTTFAINTWYKLRMDVLFSTKKSSHYINGTRYTTDVNFSDVTATGITKFSSWRYSWGNAYYTWVDNIRIRKYAAVDPIVTTGQEEHTRKGGILIY